MNEQDEGEKISHTDVREIPSGVELQIVSKSPDIVFDPANILLIAYLGDGQRKNIGEYPARGEGIRHLNKK